jgi:hypothetical protein
MKTVAILYAIMAAAVYMLGRLQHSISAFAEKAAVLPISLLACVIIHRLYAIGWEREPTNEASRLDRKIARFLLILSTILGVAGAALEITRAYIRVVS